MSVAIQPKPSPKKVPTTSGSYLRSGREQLRLSRYEVSRALDLREDVIRFLESGAWAMSPSLTAYAGYLESKLGSDWLLQGIEAAEMRFKARQMAAPLAQRFAMIDRAERAQEGRRVQRKTRSDVTLSEMAQNGATVRSGKRVLVAQGNRAAVKMPRLQSVSERIQAAWGMKPLTLDGLAA